MHIAEGFLPASHVVGWSVAAAPFVWHALRVTARDGRPGPGDADRRLSLAASAGFTLVLSALKIPSVAGSCSHPTGTGLGALAVGAQRMPLIGVAVLLWQALFLAHGGLSTLGANVMSMAIVGPWCTVGTAAALRCMNVPAPATVLGAVWSGSMATYVTTALQMALAYPAATGGVPAAFAKFLVLFGGPQIPIAAVEAALTLAVVRGLASRGIPGFSSPGRRLR
jgi:cobalt/nickel transport system permease protein